MYGAPIPMMTPVMQGNMIFQQAGPQYQYPAPVMMPTAPAPIAAAPIFAGYSEVIVSPPKGRKCRDILCLLIFVLYLGAGIFGIVHFGLFNDMKSSSILLRYSDGQRRICGYKTQPDALAVDYSRMLEPGYYVDFCKLWDKVYAYSSSCNTLSGDSDKLRQFFAKSRLQGTDMENQSLVLQGIDAAICLKDTQNACDFAQNVEYVCDSDFLKFIRQTDGNAGYDKTQFTQAEFTALKGSLGVNSFILGFCVKIMKIENSTAKHYVRNSFLQQTGVQQCNADLSTFAKTKGVSAVVQQIVTVFSSFWSNLVLELQLTWRYILYGTLIGLGLMVVYLTLVQFIMKFLVYGVIVLALLICAGGGGYFIYQGIVMKQQAETIVDVFGFEDVQLSKYYTLYMTLGGILAAIVLIIVVFLIICCKRVRMGIAVLQSAIKCSRKTWTNFLLPLPFVLFIVIHLCWTGVAAFQFYLQGTYDARARLFSFYKYEKNAEGIMLLVTDWERTGIFIAFVFLVVWGVFAIFDMLQYMICYAVSSWYFSNKETRVKYFSASIGCMLKSMGTCCLTSFITSLIWIIRFIINYAVKRMEQGAAIAKQSKVIRGAVAVGQCCLKCLEKIVKWINRNILVYASITGAGYCKSMTGAMKLLMGSFMTSASVKILSVIFLEASKLIIAVGDALLTMYLIYKFGDDGHQIIPAICVGLLVYLLSYYVIGIMSITVDTVLMCFLYEEDNFRTQRAVTGVSYAPKELEEFLSIK